jgi:hypothetical protein
MVKNLSQLKKVLVSGAEFEIVQHIRPDCVGQVRKISEANTVGFYSTIPAEPGSKTSLGNGGKGSYCEWGPAGLWEFSEDGVCKVHSKLLKSPLPHGETLIMAFKVLS